ncbi:growth-regulating factor 3-like isoform X2 [Silene latifolia]|uniref:growth-regulating factor 3-like isoform X2 n=1 Tax=Silene latifolia TaxID=37657 RepID=UPI003D778064
MEFNLKHWRDEEQQESEDEQQQQSSTAANKIPRKLVTDSPQNHQHYQPQQNIATALPLFYDHSSSTPTAIPTSTPTFSGVGKYRFSMAQWQELELQALIYRHMVAGSTIPSELLHLLNNTLLTSPYYLHHYPPPALLQAGYWGKGALDPEPGRCKRTDGKKWRCSRDVVSGHKYCERHVHRGRNRSRKPVEFPPATSTANGTNAVPESLTKPSAAFTGGSSGASVANFSLSRSGAASFEAFQLHSGSGDFRSDKKIRSDTQHDSTSRDDKSNNRVLMDLFDDWPKSLHGHARPETNCTSSSTSLSISTLGNPTSNFLRLSTGNVDELGRSDVSGPQENEDREREQISWTGGWGGSPVASMGGPLAEVLRSSSNSSPTSVLHQLPRCAAPDTSFVTA